MVDVTSGGLRIQTLCLSGSRALPVELELQFTGGLMQRIIMAGLPGCAVREARDRIRGCLTSAGLALPKRSVLASFAPADVPKDGNGFDLPLALGLLALQGEVPREELMRWTVLGELALDGRLRPVRGALSLALGAREAGHTHLMVPAADGPVTALVKGLRVAAVPNLAGALEVLHGHPPPPPAPAEPVPEQHPDLADVRGQDTARRALEIAAAGAHNLLLVGPPGTGKTMLATRLAGLLPDMDEDTALSVTALHGLRAGGCAQVLSRPPLRAPHHTVSRQGLVGGGRPLVPGEISLAHGGVLMLDEVAEFPRSLIETLRQPIEEGHVHLARAGNMASFPCRFQLVATMNPCPCGMLGHPLIGCDCTPSQVQRYRARISRPIWDRFDLGVEVPVPKAGELMSERHTETSADVARRVHQMRHVPRSGDTWPADAGARRLLDRAVKAFGLSGRGLHRLVAVARTVAALDDRSDALQPDLEEALALRRALPAPARMLP